MLFIPVWDNSRIEGEITVPSKREIGKKSPGYKFKDDKKKRGLTYLENFRSTRSQEFDWTESEADEDGVAAACC